MLYYYEGKYAEASEYYEKALAIEIKDSELEHSDTAKTYNNIGLVYLMQGDYPNALEYYRKAIFIYEKLKGTKDLEIATFYNYLSLLKITNYFFVFTSRN